MPMKNGLIICIIFLFTTLCSSAQFVNFGQDRPSLRWKQIKTDNFQIIYPDFFETNAQKVANIYERLYRHANTLQQKPRRISMILHADGGVSNGNVALAPRKSELYTMPSQDPTDSWLEHLCVHEFRHVVQFDKVNQGLTKGLYYLFGELFPIAVVGVYVPMWFMEGDAVCFETSVGHLGRGRSPEFLNEMKAQVVEKGIYNFPKAVLGSYKDFVPNRYNMGYFMTANSRVNYGSDIWAKALERVGRRPYGITPFSKSLKLTMRGKRDSLWNDPTFRSLFTNPDSVKMANRYRDAKRTLYLDNFSELQQIWKREAAAQGNDFDTVATRNKYYTNYFYPTPLEDNSIIAYKKGLQQTGAFVRLDGQKEKLLTRTGIPDDYKFAVNHNQIVWSEYRPHLRWDQGGRMRLSSFDLQTRRYKRSRGRNNQFSPFRAGDNWGFVEVDNRNQAFLVITDASLKKELWRFQANEDELFIHPSFAGGKITTVVQSPKGIHLESIDPATSTRQRLTEDIYYELDNPVAVGNTVVYRASYNGNNAFYRTDNGTPEKILGGRYGLRFPSVAPDSNRLYFSFYTADGYKPGYANIAELKAETATYTHFPLADSMRRQENWQLSLGNDSVYSTRRYNKFTHLVNIHSWAPLSIDLNDMDVDIGAVVYSQNKLSTLSFTAGYVLKSGFDHGAWMLNATYSGWWPVIGLNLESGREDYYALTQGINQQTDSVEGLYVFNRARRSSADIIIQLPFNLAKKQYNRYLRPYVRYKVEGLHRQRPRDVYNYQIVGNTAWLSPVNKHNYSIHQSSRYYQLMEYGITFSNQTRMTEQEINPRWGQILSVGFTHALDKGLELGHQWWADSRFYFPGIATNHSLGIYSGFQHMSDRTRNYGNKILYPRGISLYGYEIATLRCSYRLPLLFPDQHLGTLLYFKGVDGCLFYDHGTSRNRDKTYNYDSYGIELTTNTHFFRLTYPIHMGFRAGYETQKKKMFADIIFSIGLSI